LGAPHRKRPQPPQGRPRFVAFVDWRLTLAFLLSLLIFQVEHLSFNDLQGLDNSYSRVLKKNLSLHFCWQSISIIVFLFGGTRLELKQLPGKFLFGKKRLRTCSTPETTINFRRCLAELGLIYVFSLVSKKASV